MSQFLLKTLLSALLIAGASELARRSTLAGALLVSLPLTSLLAIGWLWHDTHDPVRIAAFTTETLWLVLPSLLFFIVLPLALRFGMTFWPSFALAITATVVAYAGALAVRAGLA
jgi:hypothetical protein